MKRKRSFKEYIFNRFYNDLFNGIQRYICNSDVSPLNLRSYSVRNFNEVELLEIEIKTASVEDLPEMEIAFDLVLEADFAIKEVTRHYDNDDTCFEWFKLKCKADLGKDLNDLKILGIEVFNTKTKQTKPLSDELVPILAKEKLDAVAEDFVKRYYAEALISPMPINPTVLAERMGLEIQEQEIAEDGSVFGQIYFRETETIKAGTILVDPQTYFLRNLGSVNNTIIHECVHWDKHRKSFEFQRLLDDSISKVSCQVSGGIIENHSDAVKWMEWQANALTPRIMMPKSMFLKKANEFLKKRFNNGDNFFDALEPAIDELAVFFGVSRLAAKIRMIDVGYTEAIGAFNYIDGRYVKPYAFEKGTLARNQTFSISAADAGLLPYVDPEFAKATAFGKYLYVDAHFVLNSPRYVTQDGNGDTILTDYARQHMNECCLVFNVSIKSSSQETRYSSECILNRDEDSPFEFEIKFNNGYQNSTPEKQAEYLASIMKENMEMYNSLSNSHTNCLEQVRKWRKMTYVAIAEKIPMDEKQVRRIFQGESNGTISTLVTICLILRLPPEISLHIIEKSPLSLSMANSDHHWYRFALQYHHGKTIQDVRAFLNTHNVAL